jgi:hypothetical protein
MKLPGSVGWRSALSSVVYLACTMTHAPLGAEDAGQTAAKRQLYRSGNLALYSDLGTGEAEALLERLEATLNLASDYWKRPCKGTVQCYVARDIDAWHDRELPHPLARIFIGRLGGAAFTNRSPDQPLSEHRILVFAAAREGVAEHEVVHAYCGQTFGCTGPAWYREGMAQLLTCGEPSRGVENLPGFLLELLDKGATPAVSAVIQDDQHGRQLRVSLAEQALAQEGLVGLVPDNRWTDDHDRSLKDLHDAYAWSWLLCHVLEYNPNYRTRFHTLGQELLTNRDDAFQRVLGSVLPQLDFEFRFTAERLAPGYRVDLCAWDWSRRCRPLDSRRGVRVRIAAARGYQSTGIVVQAGQSYAWKAPGRWTIDPQIGQATADGDPHGGGRLEGVVFHNFQLSPPIQLGSAGTFTAPCDGALYLRCGDQWHGLGDNEGSIVVTLARSL